MILTHPIEYIIGTTLDPLSCPLCSTVQVYSVQHYFSFSLNLLSDVTGRSMVVGGVGMEAVVDFKLKLQICKCDVEDTISGNVDMEFGFI